MIDRPVSRYTEFEVHSVGCGLSKNQRHHQIADSTSLKCIGLKAQ